MVPNECRNSLFAATLQRVLGTAHDRHLLHAIYIMLKLLVAIAGVASVSWYSVHLSPRKPATTAVNARCSQIPSMKVSDEEQARLVAQAEALRAAYEAQAAREEVAREQVSDQRYAKQEAGTIPRSNP